MTRCVLALDQGTTSSRAILFDRRGRPLASAQEELRQHFPHPGVGGARPRGDLGDDPARRAGRPSEGRGPQGRGGGGGDREPAGDDRPLGAEDGRPLHRAIVWQDRRTAPPAPPLSAAAGAPLQEEDRPPARPLLLGTKLAWLLDHVRGRERARNPRGARLRHGRLLAALEAHPGAGARHRCLERVADAPRRLRSGDWEGELTRALRIPRTSCPRCVPSSGVFGEISAIDALRGVPVAGMAGDQQAALFGQGCFGPGMAKNTYGTGCFMLDEHRDPARRVQAPAPHHHRLADRGAHRVCARGQRLRRRRRRPVAS